MLVGKRNETEREDSEWLNCEDRLELTSAFDFAFHTTCFRSTVRPPMSDRKTMMSATIQMFTNLLKELIDHD